MFHLHNKDKKKIKIFKFLAFFYFEQKLKIQLVLNSAWLNGEKLNTRLYYYIILLSSNWRKLLYNYTASTSRSSAQNLVGSYNNCIHCTFTGKHFLKLGKKVYFLAAILYPISRLFDVLLLPIQPPQPLFHLACTACGLLGLLPNSGKEFSFKNSAGLNLNCWTVAFISSEVPCQHKYLHLSGKSDIPENYTVSNNCYMPQNITTGMGKEIIYKNSNLLGLER